MTSEDRPVSPMEILDRLSLAAAFLVDGGWTQGCVARDAGRWPVPADSNIALTYCAVGAILAGRQNEDLGANFSPVEMAVTRVLAAALPGPQGPQDVTSWNDHPERRPEEVLELFSRAAHALSSK